MIEEANTNPVDSLRAAAALSTEESPPAAAKTHPSASGMKTSSWRKVRRFRGWLFAPAVIVACLLPPVIRIYLEGKAELEAAQRAANEHQVEDQIVHLGRAARWYLPIPSHDDEALLLLIEIGEQSAPRLEGNGVAVAEENAENADGDGLEVALRAYREARGAILATRTWEVAHPQTLADLDRRIAQLMAEQERRLGTDLSGIGDPYHHHLALLESVPAQRSRGTWMASATCLAWVAMTVLVISRATQSRDRASKRWTLLMGIVSAFGLILWMVLLRYPEILDG
jgi:hypothetical protein